MTDRKEGLWSYYSLCPRMDALAAAHLKLLKANLSQRADSKQLLTKLNVWLKAKKSGETCLKNGYRVQVVKNAKGSSAQTYAAEMLDD